MCHYIVASMIMSFTHLPHVYHYLLTSNLPEHNIPLNLMHTVTTSVQSVTAEAGFEDAVLTCHFLMGARADGCLVEWSEVNSTESSNGTLLISRPAGFLVANGTITGLQENAAYTVRAFGTRAGANLNEFVPIVLPSDLVTLERPTG